MSTNLTARYHTGEWLLRTPHLTLVDTADSPVTPTHHPLRSSYFEMYKGNQLIDLTSQHKYDAPAACFS